MILDPDDKRDKDLARRLDESVSKRELTLAVEFVLMTIKGLLP
jgi:hypothetical protein